MTALLTGCPKFSSAIVFSSSYQRERVTGWLRGSEMRQEENFQPIQACIALGSGGLMGRGLARGRQQRGFLPEAFSDFILAVIGEETGFMGTTLLLTIKPVKGVSISAKISGTINRGKRKWESGVQLRLSL